jgi:hypothetical protein
MVSIIPNTRRGALCLWVLVFLVLFLAICGIHLLGIHHDGHAHAIQLAITVAVVLMALANGKKSTQVFPQPAIDRGVAATARTPQVARPIFTPILC